MKDPVRLQCYAVLGKDYMCVSILYNIAHYMCVYIYDKYKHVRIDFYYRKWTPAVWTHCERIQGPLATP